MNFTKFHGVPQMLIYQRSWHLFNTFAFIYIMMKSIQHEILQNPKKILILQAKRIFITAEHRFLYQYSRIENDNKVVRVKGEIINSNSGFTAGHSLLIDVGGLRVVHCYTVIRNGFINPHFIFTKINITQGQCNASPFRILG